MSWFGNKKNGEYTTHNNPRPGELGHVHHPVIIDHNGVKHPIVGFGYERHDAQRYMARTEQVVKYSGFPGKEDEEYIPSRTEEYRTGDLSGRTDVFPTKSHDERVRGPIKDFPGDNGFRFNSPPSKDHRYTTHDDDKYQNVHSNNNKWTRPTNMKDQEYHDDEKYKRNGFTTQGFIPNNLRDQQDYYEHVNPRTNGYSPPKYSVPTTYQDHEEENGNDYATRARMGPFGKPPSNETSIIKPLANSPPRFNPQPKNEQINYNQETIDSAEARRRYGMGVPRAGAGLYAEDKYTGGTIDCKEAAKIYNGVLLNN